MKTFTDTAGRSWSVTIDVDAIRRVRDLTGVNLLSIVEPGSQLPNQLADDVVLLCDVLYAVIQPQADDRGVSSRDFGRSLSGDVIDAATTALLEDLISFFPSRRRAILQRLHEQTMQALADLASRLEEAATEMMNDPTFQSRLVASLSGNCVGSSPASSESIPAA